MNVWISFVLLLCPLPSSSSIHSQTDLEIIDILRRGGRNTRFYPPWTSRAYFGTSLDGILEPDIPARLRHRGLIKPHDASVRDSTVGTRPKGITRRKRIETGRAS